MPITFNGATIQLRRDTAANWTTNNPTLADGEIGIETDTNKGKIGDGSTAWTSLAYVTQWGAAAALPDVAQRSGSSIAFDGPAIYNTPSSPSSGTISYDLSGATVGVEVIAHFNHSGLPTFPAGTFVYGAWDNSQVNVVRFIYGIGGAVTAIVNNNAAATFANRTTSLRPSAIQSTTGTSLVGVTGMSTTVRAGRSYRVTGKLRVLGTGTGGFRFGMIVGAAYPAIAQNIQMMARATVASNSAITSDHLDNTQGYNNISAVTLCANTSGQSYVYFEGTIDVGAADVSVQVGYASATNGQSAAIFVTGSLIQFIEL